MLRSALLTSRLGFASRCIIVAVLWAVVAAGPSSVGAYTPESPEVKAIVDRGIKYLETVPAGENAALDGAGAMFLVGITLIKTGKDESHPLVAAGVKKFQSIMNEKRLGENEYGGIYWMALALIFICEVDPVKYRAEATFFLDGLLKRQQPGGAWSYPSSSSGDTSQTQYGVLALWTADHAGLDVPTERIERVCHWLLRTQDVGGGWVYQGTDPAGGPRIAQSGGGVTPSLSAAGLGSVYISGDLLGMHGATEIQGDNDGLPSALRLQKTEEKKGVKKKRTTKIDAVLMRRGIADGNAWFNKFYVINPMAWPLYYLYALERYQSFRELAENRMEKEPKWYDEGVIQLAKTQQSAGNWAGDHNEQVSTCFAILFLIRSTKKTIAKVVASEGALAGGRGLPTDVTNVKMKGNQVVGVSTTKTIDDLLNLLENPETGELENALESAAQLTLGSDAPSRAKQAERLRKIVSQSNYQARVLAVKTLSLGRDLENVPVLIYALGDPDWRVAKEARDGLKLISRRLDGFEMPDRSTPAQRATAQQSWKQWYLSIRPEAEFLD